MLARKHGHRDTARVLRFCRDRPFRVISGPLVGLRPSAGMGLRLHRHAPLLSYRDHVRQTDLHFDRNAYVVPLEASADQLFGRMSLNRRRQIRAWRDSGRKTTCDAERIADFLVGEAPAFYRARHASAAYAIAPSGWSLLLAQPEVFAIGAIFQGRVVAASVFAAAAGRGEYLFNISTPAGQADSGGKQRGRVTRLGG